MGPVTPGRDVDAALEALAAGRHRDPFALLGPHRIDSEPEVIVRAIHPAAMTVDLRVIETGRLYPMTRRKTDGVFEVRLQGEQIPEYRLRVAYPRNHVLEIDDPYRYGRVLTDFDLHLLGEGTHYRAFERLGAHRIQVGSITGIHFAV